MACRDLDALDFARLKYEHIRRMQGEDPIADRMIERVDALKAVAEDARKTGVVSTPSAVAIGGAGTGSGSAAEIGGALGAFFEFVKRWRTPLFFTPLGISMVLIVWGMSHASARNMIGTGIAISLLFYGVAMGFRRSSLR